MSRLYGKKVLITGTAGGQGYAAQRIFAGEGARVIGCDVQEGAAEKSAAEMKDAGYEVDGYTVDLADPDAARAWVENAVEAMDGLDVLYNNASGYGFAPFPEMTIELFRHVLRVELEIIFNTCHPAWQALGESGGGSIINTSSTSAIIGSAQLGAVAHAAAKGGVLGMSRSLAAEGAENDIRVNAILPGFVASPGTDAAVTDELRAQLVSQHLIQRPGTGEDIANCALYLASDESTWVTGQNFVIDGGVTAGFR